MRKRDITDIYIISIFKKKIRLTKGTNIFNKQFLSLYLIIKKTNWTRLTNATEDRSNPHLVQRSYSDSSLPIRKHPLHIVCTWNSLFTPIKREKLNPLVLSLFTVQEFDLSALLVPGVLDATTLDVRYLSLRRAIVMFI